jgi:primosomal protein N' (replication factor Y)
MKRPGLIIIDEEHDSSFKQQEGFRFSARDVAIKKAQYLGIPVVMGSATPSLESLSNVARGRYRSLALPDRAGGAAKPGFRLLDIRSQRLHEGLSPRLISSIEQTLGRGEQVLLFLNRRGFAPTLICHRCGWVAPCPRCDARLVVHLSDGCLRCHYCAYEKAVPPGCPKCAAADLRPLGLGTERLEQNLAELFRGSRILRIDRDSTNRVGCLEKTLEKIHSGSVDILLGTQMIAKGHHFPRVTLVGIVDVDAMLFATDFRAGERTSQLIVQVAGRAGRADKAGTVVLQTRHPHHPLLRTLIEQGYPGFAAAALAERRLAALPPMTHMAVWRAEALDQETPLRFLTDLGTIAGEPAFEQVVLLGPAPAPMLRQGGRYRYQLALQSTERKPLHALIHELEQRIPRLSLAKRVRWSVDVDPIDCY